ncbi:MAG: WYL domain-containing protein [Clostridia bacterium]|nr:WYL domain-containing protein [Clostridia bacterium]
MNDNRERFLRVRDILLATDEDHPVTSAQIVARLDSVGLSCDRKAVLRDIEALTDYGMDILKCPDNKTGVFLGSRDFEDWELKILIDAVQSANFLTRSQTDGLVQRLSALASDASAQTLAAVPKSPSSIKRGEGETKNHIETLLHAIRKRCKVHFLYTYTGGDMATKFRHSKKTEPVSPYALIWQHDKYYLIGNWSGAAPFSYYRLDRIHKLEILENVPAVPLDELLPNGEKGLRNYIDENIYATSGKRVLIELEGFEDMTDTVLDAFGDNAVIEQFDTDRIRCRIKTNENKGLYGWLMEHAENLKVISPEHIRDGVRDRLRAALGVYEEEHEVYRNMPPQKD